MTDMVERVARVLCARDYPCLYGPDSVSAYDWMHHLRDEYNAVARAAIEAMREPTAEMCEAEPTNAYGDDGEWADHFSPSRGIWQGMIDVALSQSGEGFPPAA